MPPRSSKRRRFPRDPSGAVTKRDEEVSEESEEEEEDDANDSKRSKDKKNQEDDRVWVQCNTCDKWRALPSTVDVTLLPDIWNCDQNIYDLQHNNCEASEETYKQPDVPLKSFLKLWNKKLRYADKAESKLAPAAVTRGRKRKADTEWIKCCNPACG